MVWGHCTCKSVIKDLYKLISPIILDPEKQPRIRDLVDDPDEVQTYFVEKNILTDYEAETILNTTVNITQVLCFD